MRRLSIICYLTIALCTTTAALAQSEEAVADEQAPDPAGLSADTSDAPEQGDFEQGSPHPEPPITWFVGAQGRMNWVPPLFQLLFLDEAPAVFSPGFNLVATHRLSSGMSVVFGLGYISYAAEGPYRDKGDPDEDTEYVDGNLGLAKVTASLLWSTQLESWIAIEYGFGLDFGIVTGELKRTEAYPDASGEWRPCNGRLDPNPQYCDLTRSGLPTDPYDERGEHYGVIEERVPAVMGFPSIPHLALRFEPDPHLALKLELAYGIVQLWFGLSAHVGFDT